MKFMQSIVFLTSLVCVGCIPAPVEQNPSISFPVDQERQFILGTIECKSQSFMTESDCKLGLYAKLKSISDIYELKNYGITTPTQYDAVIAEMRQYQKYDFWAGTQMENIGEYFLDKKSANAQNITLAEYLQQLDELAEKKQRAFDKEFVFEAVISCQMSEQISFKNCFFGEGGNGVIEIKNGSEYGMYRIYGLDKIPGISEKSLSSNELIINLREHFELSIQNSSSYAILNLKIKNRKTQEIIFEKSASTYGAIRVGN